ncbi:hypothetical protein H8959_021153 [Pygathrix nigripes]
MRAGGGRDPSSLSLDVPTLLDAQDTKIPDTPMDTAHRHPGTIGNLLRTTWRHVPSFGHFTDARNTCCNGLGEAETGSKPPVPGAHCFAWPDSRDICKRNNHVVSNLLYCQTNYLVVAAMVISVVGFLSPFNMILGGIVVVLVFTVLV